MNKKTICTLLVFPVSLCAHAQSSVTLYGLLDNGLAYVSNAHGARQYSVSTSNLQGDRWGLRGYEDLGDGFGAIFQLENGFNVDTGALGQGGAEFGRRAFVGVTSPYGTVTIGRLNDPVGDFVGGFESANTESHVKAGEWGSIPGAHPGDLDNLDNTFHINNSVKYTSNSLNGLVVGGMYTFGGIAGNFRQNQLYGIGARYDRGPLSAGVAFERAQNPNYAVWGVNPNASSPASANASNMTSPVYSGYASAGTWQVLAAGGAYQIGDVTLGAVYSNVKFLDLGATAGAGLNPRGLSGHATFNVAELSAAWLVRPEWQVGVAWTYTHGASSDSTSAASYNQVNVGSNYFLSKTTDLYLVGLFQRASGIDSTGADAVAAINALTPSSSRVQTAAIVGIRHKF
ncbi:putative porin [Paraburkholderia caballeronis]|uniref:porin n=1 Tax=Paraburkholderia caballeronis TaxID=416943 RepID=UPI00106612A3|nr:porin [Paraburkholderia caballeronis]TDV35764.1 putative porin [Paraburkholderia caballeronis]